MTTDGERESDLACGASFTRDDGHKGHCCIDVGGLLSGEMDRHREGYGISSSAFHASWRAHL